MSYGYRKKIISLSSSKLLAIGSLFLTERILVGPIISVDLTLKRLINLVGATRLQ